MIIELRRNTLTTFGVEYKQLFFIFGFRKVKILRNEEQRKEEKKTSMVTVLSAFKMYLKKNI